MHLIFNLVIIFSVLYCMVFTEICWFIEILNKKSFTTVFWQVQQSTRAYVWYVNACQMSLIIVICICVWCVCILLQFKWSRKGYMRTRWIIHDQYVFTHTILHLLWWLLKIFNTVYHVCVFGPHSKQTCYVSCLLLE